MTKDKETIVVDVPPGFPAMSTPVDEAERFSDSDIVISRAEEKDLPDIADGIHSSFPEVWWSGHEPESIRAPPDLRRARMVKRISPMIHWDLYHPIKASLRSTGEFVGLAGWLAPNDTVYKSLNGKLQGLFGKGAVPDAPEGLGFAKLMGWSEADVKEMWEGVDVDHWEAEFGTYDRVRKEEMGSTPHWYLAPLFVVEKFRGRGAGKRLLDYATEQADAQSPPTPLYLEALPNARPVYMHCGFEGMEGPDRGSVMIRNKPKGAA